MGGKPRTQQQWAPKPSPLAEVHHSRKTSQDPTMGLVRDPQFWKRFSLAVHQIEEDPENAGSSTKSGSSRGDKMDGRDAWLAQQHKERRKCRILCVSITLGAAILITIAIILALFLKKWIGQG